MKGSSKITSHLANLSVLTIGCLLVIFLLYVDQISVADNRQENDGEETQSQAPDKERSSQPNDRKATVRFRFFDETGRELNFDSVILRMTNRHPDGAKILSEGTVDIDTLKVLMLGPSYQDRGFWTVAFDNLKTHPRQGWMVHWDTETTGYSNFLLDNEGRGFSTSGTLVFNEQLARDARRHLHLAKASKPDYVPSSRFKELEQQINVCFLRLSSMIEPAGRGRIGQQCVDLLAQAMNVLLKEYGVQRARALAKTKAKWGVTIIPQHDLKEKFPIEKELVKIDDLTLLFDRGNCWARIAIHGTGREDHQRIKAILKYATEKGVKTMGQLFDSKVQAEVPLATFKKRVDRILNDPDYGTFSAWEVGNEANGGWVGKHMIEKIRYASTQVRKRFPEKPVYLTLYWYSVQDTYESSLFNWIDANVTKDIKDNIDGVMLSIYIDEQPLNFTWDMVMTKLSELFPDKEIMVGEVDFPGAHQHAYTEGQRGWNHQRAIKAFVTQRYAASFATPNSVGGAFWWFYDDDMVGRTPLWHALRSFYQQVYVNQ